MAEPNGGSRYSRPAKALKVEKQTLRRLWNACDTPSQGLWNEGT